MMNEILDAYVSLACAVLHQAILDARQPSVKTWPKLEARVFLMSPEGEWLAESVGLDAEALREKALLQWVAKVS